MPQVIRDVNVITLCSEFNSIKTIKFEDICLNRALVLRIKHEVSLLCVSTLQCPPRRDALRPV